MQDAVNGTTSVYIESLSGLSGLIQSGTLKALAVASARRLSNLPNVPTVAEAVSGLGVFEARGWFAMMAPAGTPYDIVRKVNRDLREALGNSELKSQFEKLGTYPLPMSPDETAKFIHDEQQLWAPIVEKVGISKH
jgi:tripartite-type tricarboxylate transporter receptor subunit TctC